MWGVFVQALGPLSLAVLLIQNPAWIRSTIRHDSPLSAPTPQQKNHPQFNILSYSSYVFPFPPQKIIHHLAQISPTPLPPHILTPTPQYYTPPFAPKNPQNQKRRQLSKPKASHHLLRTQNTNISNPPEMHIFASCAAKTPED
jgi:hypothetical protein